MKEAIVHNRIVQLLSILLMVTSTVALVMYLAPIHTSDREVPVSKASMFYTLRERVVNLADNSHYLKIEILMELPVDAQYLKARTFKERYKYTSEIAQYQPQLDKQLNGVLTSKTSTLLATDKGKQELIVELQDKFGLIIEKEVVVHITQFVIT